MFWYMRAVIHNRKDRPALPLDLPHHPAQLRLVALVRLEHLEALPFGDLFRTDIHPVDEGEGQVLQPQAEGALLVDADLQYGVVGEGAVRLQVPGMRQRKIRRRHVEKEKEVMMDE
jgi:hypothetical protein